MGLNSTFCVFLILILLNGCGYVLEGAEDKSSKILSPVLQLTFVEKPQTYSFINQNDLSFSVKVSSGAVPEKSQAKLFVDSSCQQLAPSSALDSGSATMTCVGDTCTYQNFNLKTSGDYYIGVVDGNNTSVICSEKIHAKIPSKILDIARETYRTCVVTDQQKLKCWGNNFYLTIQSTKNYGDEPSENGSNLPAFTFSPGAVPPRFFLVKFPFVLFSRMARRPAGVIQIGDASA